MADEPKPKPVKTKAPVTKRLTAKQLVARIKRDTVALSKKSAVRKKK